MTINVSEALDSDTAERITVSRFGTGAYVDGEYVPATPSTFKALASVQQPTPQQIEFMPSGERNNDPRLMICNKLLREASTKEKTVADKIHYKGKIYKVVQVMDWTAFGHCKVLATRDKRAEP